MNIQQFQYVLAVVEHKHFETAAESCFVTQSTLSTMINRLEEEIGIKIFNRKTKPVSITKEGEMLIERLRIINNEIDSFNNVVQELKGEMTGELNIGIIPTVAPDLLPLFLSQFAKQYPKVTLVVQEMTTTDIKKSLKNRTLDIGILAIPIADSELVEHTLYLEPFVVYDCSMENRRVKISINQLDYSKLWLLEEGHCLTTQVQSICDVSNKAKHRGNNIEFKAASLGSLLRFTQSNRGTTILPYLSSQELSVEEQENVIPFSVPVPVRSIGLVTHKHFVKKKLLRELEKTIKVVVNPLLPTLEGSKEINPI